MKRNEKKESDRLRENECKKQREKKILGPFTNYMTQQN